MTLSILLGPVYAITDPDLLPREALMSGVEQALNAGIRVVQLRDKTVDWWTAIARARDLLSLCKRCHAQLIINDHIDLAAEIGADGVHLGRSDGSIATARQKLGPNAIIGATCHNNLEWAQAAVDAGADYIAFGRFYSSSTKPAASNATIELLRQAKNQFSVPIVAIGGVTSDNAADLFAAGADVVAVCAGIFAATQIDQAALLIVRTASISLARRTSTIDSQKAVD